MLIVDRTKLESSYPIKIPLKLRRHELRSTTYSITPERQLSNCKRREGRQSTSSAALKFQKGYYVRNKQLYDVLQLSVLVHLGCSSERNALYIYFISPITGPVGTVDTCT